MKRRTRYICLSLAVLILGSAGVYSALQTRTSFKELVLDQMNASESVNEMRIIKNRHQPDGSEQTITDQAIITAMMKNLSDIRLRKGSAQGNSGDEYEIWFHTWSGPTFGIHYGSPNYLRIYNGSSNQKKYSWEYKVVSPFDPSVIEDLFKSNTRSD